MHLPNPNPNQEANPEQKMHIQKLDVEGETRLYQYKDRKWNFTIKDKG